MQKLTVVVLFLLLAGSSHSQENPAILQFDITQVQAGAQLNFTLAAGNTCLGIRILRSSDNTSFSEIGFIGGVCGSVSDDISYSYTDSMPLSNRTGYYKLDLELLGTSAVHSFRYINFESEQVVAIPNISDGLFHLYFQNPQKVAVRLTVYDLTGRKIKESDYPGISTIDLDLSNERAGEFIFTINIDNIDSYNGKLIVY
jgi:hypothetical protein